MQKLRLQTKQATRRTQQHTRRPINVAYWCTMRNINEICHAINFINIIIVLTTHAMHCVIKIKVTP